MTVYNSCMALRFSAVVWEWRGPAPFYFLTVPEDEGKALKEASKFVTYGWGMIPVHAQIGATVWKTSLFAKNGSYVVPLKDLVRKAEAISVGDLVEISLEILISK